VATSVGPTPYLPDTFRDGTPYSMTVNPANGRLLLAFENYDRSLPKGNIWLTQSADEGKTWSKAIQVNDPSAPGDTFQQKVFAAPNGDFAIAFYDRRLACPPNDPLTANIGHTNTCIDVTVQFYNPSGTPLGGNRRATLESWDPNVAPAQPGGLSGTTTFIGDYFGGAMTSSAQGTVAHLLFVSTSPDYQAGAVAGGGLAPHTTADLCAAARTVRLGGPSERGGMARTIERATACWIDHHASSRSLNTSAQSGSGQVCVTAHAGRPGRIDRPSPMPSSGTDEWCRPERRAECLS
jgi:hypothetical protein